MSTFIPSDFKSPKTPGQYLKLQDGESVRIRIMSKPIFFWQYWSKENKPLRVEYDGSFCLTPEGADPTKKVAFCWAMVIWNYSIDKLQIWSPSQAAFKNALEAYDKDPDIGDPMLYDIKIGRKGTMMDTEYSIMPLMKAENTKPMNPDIVRDASLISLKALILNLNPFEDLKAFEEKTNIAKDIFG